MHGCPCERSEAITFRRAAQVRLLRHASSQGQPYTDSDYPLLAILSYAKPTPAPAAELAAADREPAP